MPVISWRRRELLITMSASAAAGIIGAGASDAAAQQVVGGLRRPLPVAAQLPIPIAGVHVVVQVPQEQGWPQVHM